MKWYAFVVVKLNLHYAFKPGKLTRVDYFAYSLNVYK